MSIIFTWGKGCSKRIAIFIQARKEITKAAYQGRWGKHRVIINDELVELISVSEKFLLPRPIYMVLITVAGCGARTST